VPYIEKAIIHPWNMPVVGRPRNTVIHVFTRQLSYLYSVASTDNRRFSVSVFKIKNAWRYIYENRFIKTAEILKTHFISASQNKKAVKSYYFSFGHML